MIFLLFAESLDHSHQPRQDEAAAAALLKGCTAEFLAERCATVSPGDAVLVHAAAGGVGLLLVQWLKHLGADVIGAVSSPEKALLAKAAGANHTLLYNQADIGEMISVLTGGKGVAVTFDGVGRETWQHLLSATRRRGLIDSFGNSSGPVTNVALGELSSAGGSLSSSDFAGCSPCTSLTGRCLKP